MKIGITGAVNSLVSCDPYCDNTSNTGLFVPLCF